MNVTAIYSKSLNFYRLIQYSCKLLAYLVERIRIGRIDLADQLKHLEFHFGTFRKCMLYFSFSFPTFFLYDLLTVLRLGKSVEVLHGILKSLHIPNVKLRSLITLSRISQSLFLLADHIIWVDRVGLIKLNSDKWRSMANRCWIYSITLNLLRYFFS